MFASIKQTSGLFTGIRSETMEDKNSHGIAGPNGSGNGSRANGSASNGSASNLSTGNGSASNGSNSATATADFLSTAPKQSDAFTFPLPARTTAAHSSGEDLSVPASTRESSRTLETRSRTVVRRDAMGVAAVRVAGRLTHTELIANQASPSSTHSSDPTTDLDELLTMLGSYLLSSGFEHPEIHAKLGGQSIVVNLVSPEISAS
jgi:hypothetical protein